MNWKSTATVSGVTLLAGWLGFTPSRPPVASVVAPVARGSAGVEGRDIQQQAARLQTRVRTELAFHDPVRNPFRFAVRPSAVPPPAKVPDTTAPPPPALPPPVPFTLSGMATDTVDGQPQRTAILTAGSDVIFARAGDRVGGYTVTAVDESGVELAGAAGVRRLALTP